MVLKSHRCAAGVLAPDIANLREPPNNRGGSSETIIRRGTGARGGEREGEIDRSGLKIHILESSA